VLKSELAIGYLVAHNPAGEERLKELVERNVFPKSALDPNFRVGIIIDHKDSSHWLVYSGDDKLPAWYINEELIRLC